MAVRHRRNRVPVGHLHHKDMYRTQHLCYPYCHYSRVSNLKVQAGLTTSRNKKLAAHQHTAPTIMTVMLGESVVRPNELYQTITSRVRRTGFCLLPVDKREKKVSSTISYFTFKKFREEHVHNPLTMAGGILILGVYGKGRRVRSIEGERRYASTSRENKMKTSLTIAFR